MDDKTALVTSNAGMRLIALQTLYNRGDFDRLQAYFTEYGTPAVLEVQSAEDRVAGLQTLHSEIGKLRVSQVLAVDKHHVVVLMAAQHVAGYFMHELTVEEDYPHKIIAYSHHSLSEENGEDSGT